MIKSLAQLRFPTHAVQIATDEQHRIHVFKYGSNSCDFDIFTDQDAASDYIAQVPTVCQYRIVVGPE